MISDDEINKRISKAMEVAVREIYKPEAYTLKKTFSVKTKDERNLSEIERQRLIKDNSISGRLVKDAHPELIAEPVLGEPVHTFVPRNKPLPEILMCFQGKPDPGTDTVPCPPGCFFGPLEHYHCVPSPNASTPKK